MKKIVAIFLLTTTLFAVQIDYNRWFDSASWGKLDVIKELVEKGANINAVNVYNDTALIRASHKNHIKIVKYLIEQKADIDAKNHMGYTALMKASAWGYEELVELLLKSGANPHIKNNNNQTAQDIAIKNRKQKVADMIKKYMDKK
jgi:ankyrin repeat protein